jgi:hypothetical protein
VQVKAMDLDDEVSDGGFFEVLNGKRVLDKTIDEAAYMYEPLTGNVYDNDDGSLVECGKYDEENDHLILTKGSKRHDQAIEQWRQHRIPARVATRVWSINQYDEKFSNFELVARTWLFWKECVACYHRACLSAIISFLCSLSSKILNHLKLNRPRPPTPYAGTICSARW